MQHTNINLLKNRSVIPEYLAPIESQYKNLSILVLLAVIVIGIGTLFAYLTIQVRYQLLLANKNRLIRQLENNKTKENMFLTVKSRIKVVDKAVAGSKPMAKIIDIATALALPPKLKVLSQSDQSKFDLSYKPDSIEDAMAMTAAMVNFAKDRQLKQPKMNSFSISNNGFSIVFNFAPLWE